MTRVAPRNRFVLLIIAAAWLAAGCATTSPPPVSGFLGDYDDFVADPADESLLWWEKAAFNWSDYDSVIIDPAVIYFHPEAEGREIQPDVIPANAALNIATSLVAFVPLDMGGAAIEVEYLDSITGERLAAGVDQKIGAPVDGVTGLTRLGHAKSAFREWAEELRRALETNP